MEFRNILTFVRLAEVRNFSKTAQQLGYSQSAVTAQIQQLERELDAQLFERIGRQVKLTQAGQRFLPRALDILNAVHRAESVVQEPEQVTGSLRIGTCESYVISVLPPILTQFIRRFPQVEVRMITGDAQDLFDLSGSTLWPALNVPWQAGKTSPFHNCWPSPFSSLSRE